MRFWGGAGGAAGGNGGGGGGDGGAGANRAATRSGQGEASQPVCAVTPSYSRHEPQDLASHTAE